MAKTRLTKLRVSEVSLVDRPANPGARVLLAKRDDGEGAESEEELDAELADALAEVEDLLAEAVPANLPADATEKRARYDAALQDSVTSIIEDDAAVEKTVLITKSVSQYRAAVAALAVPVTTTSETETMTVEKKDEKAGLSPEANTQVADAITKAVAPVLEQLKKADETVAKLQTELAKRDRVAKAKALVGTTNADVAAIEAALEKSGDAPEVEKALADMIGKLAEAQKVSGIFKEVGSKGETDTSPEAVILTKAADIRKADPKLSEAAAYSRAIEQNPDLYDALLRGEK